MTCWQCDRLAETLRSPQPASIAMTKRQDPAEARSGISGTAQSPILRASPQDPRLREVQRRLEVCHRRHWRWLCRMHRRGRQRARADRSRLRFVLHRGQVTHPYRQLLRPVGAVACSCWYRGYYVILWMFADAFVRRQDDGLAFPHPERSRDHLAGFSHLSAVPAVEQPALAALEVITMATERMRSVEITRYRPRGGIMCS